MVFNGSYIITGMPRSGTAFMAELLTAAGSICSHEHAWGFWAGTKREFAEGEASFLAVPDLAKFKGKIFHIVRNPLRVIASLMEKDFLERPGNEYMEAVVKELPKIKELTGLDKYSYFWTEWNKRIEKYAHKRFKLEDVNKDREGVIKTIIGKAAKNIFTRTGHNEGSKKYKLEIDDMPKSGHTQNMIDLAAKYGYDLSTKKVLVAILNQGWIRPELANTVTQITADNRFITKTIFPNLKPAQHNRCDIVNKFLASDYDYLLCIDHDNPPRRNVLDLVELELDIVGSAIPQWHEDNIYWVVMDKVKDGYKQVPPERQQGLQKVDAVGSGCMLIKREVLEKIRAPFERLWNKDGTAEKGLDFYFCDKARKKGFDVWAHFDYPCSHFKEVDLMKVAKMKYGK